LQLLLLLLLLLQVPTAAICCAVPVLLLTSPHCAFDKPHKLFDACAQVCYCCCCCCAAAAVGPNSCNLLRRAGVAFDKLQKVLESCEPAGEGFGTPVGREFVGVLSKVLLPNPQYCQRSTVATFQGRCNMRFPAAFCMASVMRQAGSCGLLHCVIGAACVFFCCVVVGRWMAGAAA
jgi:hypothetical protein